MSLGSASVLVTGGARGIGKAIALRFASLGARRVAIGYLRGDAAAEVKALKDAVAGDLLVAGSASLVQTLVEHGLVDEFRLMVFPIVLGSGKRLFGDVSEAPVLALDEVTTVGAGIVILTYHPAPAGGAA